jgi:hypothetical protein
MASEAMMRLPHCFPAAAVLAVLALAARAQTPAPPAAGGVVELPKFEVTDSRILPPPEPWRYAAIPGFEILSNVSVARTKAFVRDFLLLEDALTVLMPAFGQGDISVPVSLILCGGASGFDRFVAADRGDDKYRTNALFFDDPERSAIVVDLAQGDLQLDATTVAQADPYRGFYKEYFRHLIRHKAGRVPEWFEEGLVQLLAAIDFNKKWITFAQLNDPAEPDPNFPTAPQDNDFVTLLRRRQLVPFAQLFSPEGRANSAWSPECYAFVHMCLYGHGKQWQKPLIAFAMRLASEEPNEALFQACFKKSYRDMEQELRAYLGFTDHKWIQLELKKGQELAEPPPVTPREASEAEAGRIVGNVLGLGGHGDEAHLALIAPYIRGQRDPQLLAALGLDERAAGHDERARKFLEAATHANVVRPRAYLELARLRYEAVQPGAEAAEKPALTPQQVSSILAPLAVARTQPPPLADVYEFTAEVWAHSAQPPKRDDLKPINQGVMLFPKRAVLLARAADLDLRFGDPEDARKIIVYGLSVLPNSPARVALAQLRDALPPEPPKPATPPAPAPARAAKQPR